MPQFDTFSFFSQLFWVFLGFTFLYLILSFYLLPAISSTLKVRKRKLAQISTSSTLVSGDDNQSSSMTNSANNLLLDYSSKLTSVSNDTAGSTLLLPALVPFFVKIESFSKLKFLVLNQIQTTALLSN